MRVAAAGPRLCLPRLGCLARIASAWLLLALALVSAPGCQRRETQLPLRTPSGDLPSVLLVTVDSLRPDHLGAYGFPMPTSPTIDRLCAGGIRITEAIATAPETAPAVASLVSGLYQYRSRVLFNRGALPANVTTLAERMQTAGYHTAGFVGTPLLSAERGFAQGFDKFETFGGDADGASAAVAWLATRPPAPWLLWVHFIAPHGPYDSADESWSATFHYPPYMFGANAALVMGPSDFGLGVLPKYQQLLGLTRPSELIRRYDGEIRYADAQIGRVLEAVAEHSSPEETLVVLTADHGESLTEHRELFQHGWFLYDPTLRVPLVLRWTGVLAAGRVIEQQVSGADLVPTLDELLGLGSRSQGTLPPFDGTSFAALLAGAQETPASVAFAIGARENHPVAMRWGGWKMIHTPAGRPPVPLGRVPAGKLDTVERFELYNLRDDSGEVQNVVHKHKRIVSLMKRRLAQFRRSLRANAARR